MNTLKERIERLRLEKARLWSKSTGVHYHRVRGTIGAVMSCISLLESDRPTEIRKDYYFRHCMLCISEMNLELGGLTRQEARARMVPKFKALDPLRIKAKLRGNE